MSVSGVRITAQLRTWGTTQLECRSPPDLTSTHGFLAPSLGTQLLGTVAINVPLMLLQQLVIEFKISKASVVYQLYIWGDICWINKLKSGDKEWHTRYKLLLNWFQFCVCLWIVCHSLAEALWFRYWINTFIFNTRLSFVYSTFILLAWERFHTFIIWKVGLSVEWKIELYHVLTSPSVEFSW